MRKLLYFFPFALLALSSCLSTPDVTPTITVGSPSGNFTGTFRRVHRNTLTNKYDTLKANLMLSLSTTAGYAVTGDTTSLHAGSKGQWGVSSNYLSFIDYTLQGTGTPKKIHLNGNYTYGYDGKLLQFYATFADTLAYQYDFTKN